MSASAPAANSENVPLGAFRGKGSRISQRSFLVSQAIFLPYQVCYLPTNSDEEVPIEDTPCSAPETAFSPLAALIAIMWGALIFIIFTLLASKRAPADMPVVGSCSAAISANYQRPNGDSAAFSSSVQWGIIAPPDDEKLGWCSFASRYLQVHQHQDASQEECQPQEGQVFRGYHDDRGEDEHNLEIDSDADARRKALKDHDPFAHMQRAMSRWWVIFGIFLKLRDSNGKRKMKCTFSNH